MTTKIAYRSICHSQNGQAAIMTALSLVPLLGMLGLVVDVGWGYYRKEAAQIAAQSAASAAVIAISSGSSFSTCNANGLTCQNATACPASPTSPPSTNMINGCLYAKENGFVNSGKQTVSMEAHGPDGVSPPVSGTSPAYWVSATVTETIPQLFSAVMRNTQGKVAARATAGLYLQASGACIYALDPTGTGLDAGGNPTVVSGCGIYVDSNSNSAMSVGGTSASVTASTIKIVGNYSTNGHPTLSPTPSTGQPITADPLANVALPTVPSRCDSSSGIPDNPVMPSDGYYVVCSGGFSMSGNPSVNLPAGVYVLKAGSIDLHNGTLRGTGVTFYMTGSFSGITINGNVDINISAPTSGATNGILFFQDRTLAVNAFSSKINGTSNTLLTGSLYFPTTKLTYSGGSDTGVNYTAIIAYDIAFQGNSYFTDDPYGSHTGLGKKTVGILE